MHRAPSPVVACEGVRIGIFRHPQGGQGAPVVLHDRPNGVHRRRHLFLRELVRLRIRRLWRRQILQRVEAAEQVTLVCLTSRRVPVGVSVVWISPALPKQGHDLGMVDLAETGDEQRSVPPAIFHIHRSAAVEQLTNAVDVARSSGSVQIHAGTVPRAIAMEPAGFEPATYALQTRRSTN